MSILGISSCYEILFDLIHFSYDSNLLCKSRLLHLLIEGLVTLGRDLDVLQVVP